jgi:DNA-binding beta-propeller fold protein YncE
MTTRDPVGFIGPLAVMAMAAVPPGPAYADGAVLVVGSRSTSPSSVGQLFVLDGATMAIRDSVTLVPSLGLDRGGFTQVVAAPDRVHVYAVAATGVYEYDLVARQVIATGPRLGSGVLAIAPDGQRLYLSDAGNFDFPGSGKIFVYDAALHVLPAFDLSTASISGVVPVTHGLTTSHDGRRLYVTSGSVFLGRLGRLFHP